MLGDELVDALWSDRPPASASKLVQVYVSQLRRALPPPVRLSTRPGAYALELADELVDAARFERLVAECASARRDGNHALAGSIADQALALWRGRAYGELGYESFARLEVERLEELRLLALEERLDAQLALGRHTEVLGEILAVATDNPSRERLQEQAMLALYRCGRQSEALDHFAALRSTLRGELGLEPGPALQELQRRILLQDVSLSSNPGAGEERGSLPVPVNRLVGRERELAELQDLLVDREKRLVVLSGAGGSGKTRLAVEAARRASPSYANGAYLVELAPLRDASLVLRTVADTVGVGEVVGVEPLDALVDALQGREVLLVVDNAEHVREASPLLVQLVERVPRLSLLVTSRVVLHVSGEHVVPVAPLQVEDAVELFGQRVSALDPSFELTEVTTPDVREICRRVDGLPLAVELAAARMRTLTARNLRERLDTRLQLLTGGPRDVPARQQTLRETIDWSVGLLRSRTRDVFARLAVFPGGATLTAADEVCGAELDMLDELVDGNLVRRLGGVDEPRFGMLETIREYALELLGGERRHYERAMAAHLADLAADAQLKGHAATEWLARLDAEVDNVRAAIDPSVGLDPSVELKLVGRFWRYWLVRGSIAEGLARIESALERAPETPSAERAHALSGAAGLAWSLGDAARARTLADDAVCDSRAVGSLYEESAAVTVLGIVANAAGDYATAMAHMTRSAELAEMLGIEPLTERLNMGVFAMEAGDLETAAPLFREVLESHRRNGTLEGIGFAAINLGLATLGLDDDPAARAHFEEARDAFIEMGFRARAGHAVQGLAAIESRAGRFESAAQLLGRASALLDDGEWSAETFDSTLAADVETASRDALGDTGFDRALAQGKLDG